MVVGEDGKKSRIAGTLQDITERKQAEDALRESDEKLRSIADAVPGAVYQFLQDKDGGQQFIFMNRGMEELLELEQSEKQVSRDQFLTYVVPEDVPALQESTKLVTTGLPHGHISTGYGLEKEISNGSPGMKKPPARLHQTRHGLIKE